MNTRIRWAVALLAAVLLVPTNGCNSRLVTVTGRVTCHGEPVPSTQVTFQPEDGSRPSKGLTDDDGRYTMKYSRTEPGCTRGPHRVYLTYVVSGPEEIHEIPPKASRELKAIIKKYGDPDKTPLHYDVTKSGQVVNIEIE